MASRTATKATEKKAAPAKKAPPLRDEWKTSVKEVRVNEQVLAEELRAHGLETRGATMALVSRLERTICGTTPPAGAELVECDTCLGKSWSSDPRCPYCGSQEDVVTSQPPSPPAAPAVASTVEPEVVELDDADVHLDDEPVEGAAPGALAVVPPEELSEEDAAAAAASAGVQPAATEVEDLNRRVSRVRELALTFVVNGWDLGKELNEIHDAKLWLNRRLGSGAPQYRSFAAFCEGEFGADRSWAYKFMGVARTFTRDQVIAHGISKMAFLVHVPEHARTALLTDGKVMAAPISTLREVAKQAKEGVSPQLALANVEAAKGGGAPPPPPPEEDDEQESEGASLPAPASAGAVATGSVAGAAAKPQKPEQDSAAAPVRAEPPTVGEVLGAAPKPAGAVDVVTMPGRFQVKLYAYTKKGALARKRRARSIADRPHGSFAFTNGAEQRFVVHANPTTGELFLVCELTPPGG